MFAETYTRAAINIILRKDDIEQKLSDEVRKLKKYK